MKEIVLTGATGNIGKALIALLRVRFPNALLTILTRSSKVSTDPFINYSVWDISQKQIDKNVLIDADAVIHLAGAGIADKRWTEKRKTIIYNSRIESTDFLVDAINKYATKLSVFVGASAIGYYGEDSLALNRSFQETDKPGTDFLAKVCKDWEAGYDKLNNPSIRVVKIRTGIVLDPNSGMLKKMRPLTNLKIAPIFGSGNQVYSWIAIEDLCALYCSAIENENFTGPYNAVSSDPKRFKNLSKAFASKGNSFYIPLYIPKWLLKLIIGQLSNELCKSQTISANKLINMNFDYQFPTLESYILKH